MNVYSYLDPDGSDLDFKLISIWEESWRRQGWKPRLLTIRDAKRHPLFGRCCGPQVLAFAQVGGGWFSSLSVINESFSPTIPRARLKIFPGGVTWASRLGAKEYAEVFPGPIPGIKVGRELISEKGPLISFAGYSSVEQVEQCLAARKKN